MINKSKKKNPTEEIEEDAKELSSFQKTVQLSGMYENWFLEYASYVILERAVPDLNDGLKPVQRRILHAMKELDDGRYNKVANIIGHAMKYHPHGDASIGDALVQLGQKDFLIDTQGNWGNIHTGDSAAAPRYIEARLSKFALEVVFNSKTTIWKASYDGRNQEPLVLPIKFPLLLLQGVEGIAVGLASKILPHNFIELIDASISILKGKDFEILPDFLTGGMVDVSKYNDGLRGGKIRIRAKISQLDKKTLVITEIPYGSNTSSLIESIINANDKGKIKIRKIEDNTARDVEILVHLLPGTSPDTIIDALYAFTECEISISPNSCIIENDKPRFVGVSEILKISTNNTVALLKRELEIRRSELIEQLLFASLEKIFIEKRIYRKIEECETWDEVIKTIDKGLQPYKKNFYRKITTDDITRLTEIKIKRISKFDSFKADEHIKRIESEIKQVIHNLETLNSYAIAYFKNIKDKYGKGRERKAEIRNFENIEAAKVAAANQKLFVNREEGFIGFGLKKDEFVCDCSDIDDVITFREDGVCTISKVSDKTFVGKNIIYANVFKKNDERTIYNLIYQDKKKGFIMVKRFAVIGVNRDKEYNLTNGGKVLYFTANPNGEAETISVTLRPKPKLKKLVFDFNFRELAIKGRNSLGNILSRHGVKKIVLKDEGVSTLGARDIWYDDSIKRLTVEKHGEFLGSFMEDDRILSINQSGNYRLYNFDLSNHFDDDQILIKKFNSKDIVSAVYFNAESGSIFLKRFLIEVTDKKVSFIGEHPDSKLLSVTVDESAKLEISFKKDKNNTRKSEIVNVDELCGVLGIKAKGKKLSPYKIEDVKWIEKAKLPDEITQHPMPAEKIQNKKINQGAKELIPLIEIEEDPVKKVRPKKNDLQIKKKSVKKISKKGGHDPQMLLDF